MANPTLATEVPQRVLESVYGSQPADWHQHSNGKGWVYKTATVEESAYLHPASIVYGDAIATTPGTTEQEVEAANARLIAAAPDLYNALQVLLALVEGECPSLLRDDHHYDIVAAALAKAVSNV